MSENAETSLAFSISVDLTDHTGTLNGCYLAGQVAEQMLGISVSDSKNNLDCILI